MPRRLPFGWPPGLWRELYPAQDLPESWIGTDGVEPRPHLDHGKDLRVVLEGKVQPTKRFVTVTESRVRQGEVTRGREAGLPALQHLGNHPFGVHAPARGAVRVRQLRE